MRPAVIVGLLAVVLAAGALFAFSPLQAALQQQLGPTATPTGTATPTETPTPTDTPTPIPTATATPSPTPVPPTSLLQKNTVVTIYGRAFDVGPILGRLGMHKTFPSAEKEVATWVTPIDRLNGDKGVVPAIHLIYAMAIPCEPGDDCLLYLEGTVDDLVEEYIKPAAQRGWIVILDSQTGRSDPVSQVKRMIDKGYLKYDNVHVAIDPEFHVYPGETLPGIPIGVIDASQVNAVQQMLDTYVVQNRLPHKKILMVHQFGDANVRDGNPFMIQNKTAVKTYPHVDLVIDADGFGGPNGKVNKYNKITDGDVYPFMKWRGIKLFFFNPYEERHHGDKPVMDWDTVLGEKDTPDGFRMRYKPDVIIVA